MAPSGSKMLGNATIWNKDNELGDGGEVFALTSKPYPIEVIEEVSSNAAASAIEFSSSTIENMTSSAELQSVSLATPLIEVEMPHESITSSADLQEVEIRNILQELD